MDNSFHGRTFGALATTGQPKYRAPFVPLVPGVTFVKFNDLDDLERKFDSRRLCGLHRDDSGRRRNLSGQSGVSRTCFALDETKWRIACCWMKFSAGLGRTGRHFAYQHYGVLPDVVTVAKPLACGLPLGAILTTERVASCMHPGMHGTTFGGGPLACAVAIEFLREEKKLLKHVRAMGEYFHAALAVAGQEAQVDSGCSRRRPDAGDGTGFGRTGERQWPSNCCRMELSSIARTKLCCVFCRRTSSRRSTWIR